MTQVTSLQPIGSPVDKKGVLLVAEPSIGGGFLSRKATIGEVLGSVDPQEFITPQMFPLLTEPTAAIQAAIDAAYEQGKSVFIPRLTTPYILTAPGSVQPGDGTWIRCLLRLRPGVSIKSNGATLKLSEGRVNPPGIFGHWRTEHDSIDNVELCGLILDGGWRQLNPALTPLTARYAFTNYAQSVDTSSGTPWDVTQVSHAIAIYKGAKVRVHDVKISNMLGYAISLGDSYAPTALRGYGMEAPHVYNFEIDNCYQGGVFLPTVWGGGSVHHGYIHGDGYYVSGIDIERHNLLDETTDVSVHDIVFDFRGSYGPISAQVGYGRAHLWQYRRALTMGYFGGVDDQLASGHKLNRITGYQCMIECFGHRNVEMDGIRLTSTYEDLSAAAVTDLIDVDGIKLYSGGSENGLSARVTNSTVRSDMAGYGIRAFNYDLDESDNTIEGPRSGAVRRQYCSGASLGNRITNIGTEASPKPAYLIEGNKGPTLIANNTVSDTRVTVGAGSPPTITYHYGTSSLARFVGGLTYPTKVFGNGGFSSWTSGGTFETDSMSVGGFQNWGNGDGAPVWPTIQIGDATGAAGLNLMPAAGGDASVFVWDGSYASLRFLIAFPGSDPHGFALLAPNGTGSSDLVAQFDGVARTMLLNHVGKGVTTSGKWDAPLTFIGGGRNFWGASDGFRTKIGAPASDTDGQRVVLEGGPGSGGTGAVVRGTATAGQTTITMAQAVPTGDDWKAQVVVNGVLQDGGADYTTNDTTTLTLSYAMSAGDTYRVRHVWS